MEHSLHVAAKHFVETVAPTSPSSNRKNGGAGDESGSESDDQIREWHGLPAGFLYPLCI